MLSDNQVEQFNRDGYLRGSRVLCDAEVETLREEMARVIDDRDRSDLPQPVWINNLTGDEAQPVWQIVNIWEASEAFRDLIGHPTIVEEMAQLTGAGALRIWHDQIQYKPASNGGVNMWHQDAPLWPILTPMTEVSAWIALDDVDEGNGCMSMVPGSHRWGNNIDFLGTLRDFDGLPDVFGGHLVQVRACPVSKGEVHFHHALTWHGSPANRSPRPRRAIALHYMTDETRYIASGGHIMQRFVEVADGEIMCGAHFPLVWQNN
jgi:hypothetical protein